MSKTIIVSNRLPLQIKIKNNEIETIPSVGGLATGMKSVHRDGNGLWIGWSGLTKEELSDELDDKVDTAVNEAQCYSVTLTEEEVDKYYYGFSNRALWPLFHYFMEFTEFSRADWEIYKQVNQKFADKVLENLEDGDTIWVHDYQLLLVPKMIRDVKPDVKIGFFLHIPFPSYEILRTFPVREQILEGMLGADLVGFHTYNYERHFLSSVQRILNLEVSFNEITQTDRIVKADSFPMGIDYKKFHEAAVEHQKMSEDEKSELQKHLDFHTHTTNNSKLILSIDRLDYTKGIAKRIRGFEYFLKKYPQYQEHVRLIILAVPSRSNVPQYQKLKKEIDELVGRINGEFSTISWTPIWYFYRSMPFENLIDLYTSSDIALVTPVRDGMNLVAKEYVATRTDENGVLILSEMAGASNELNEALLINPNNFKEMADALKQAIEMPEYEQKKRMKFMQKRLKRYSVEKWADEFMESLENATKHEEQIESVRLTEERKEQMLEAYKQAENRLFFLDYDGTLVGFVDDPKDADPDEELHELLQHLTNTEKNTVTLISGRDKETFDEWFVDKDYNLITDHGVWIKKGKKDWEAIENLKNDWMEKIRPVLEKFVDRTPGTFIETKRYSLAWHYRKADPDLAKRRKQELNTVLTSLIANHDLTVLKGNNVMEIKSSNVNKGRACSRLMTDADNEFDFVFCIGDDWTDEFMFEELPESAYNIKVGYKKTAAKYFVRDTNEVRSLLKRFTDL